MITSSTKHNPEKKKRKTLLSRAGTAITCALVMILILALAGCSSGTPTSSAATSAASSSSATTSSSATASDQASDASEDPEARATAGANLVDKRVELISVIFRLAGHDELNVSKFAYQKELDTTFASYKNHPAVTYAASKLSHIGPGYVLAFALHIKPDMSGLISDLSGLVGVFGDKWTSQTITEFFPLVLDFYKDTKFNDFYKSKESFYLSESKLFAEDKRVINLDKKWFLPWAERFDVATKYDFVVSPSISVANHAVRVADVNYAVMSSNIDASLLPSGFLVHEYVHSFGDGIGIMWYMENARVREIAEAANNPFYPDPMDVAIEYMVRSYTILYFADRGDTEAISILMKIDKSLGFAEIEEVYGLVRKFEKRD